MKENAILVSKRVEAIYVDFKDTESIKRSLGFRKPYFIHSPKLMELSKQVGFPVGGLCDDLGSTSYDLACEISGYERLPSPLLLLELDGNEYRPLLKDKLLSLYRALCPGLPNQEELKRSLLSFFEKLGIDPILPSFNGVGFEPNYFQAYKQTVAIRYDEGGLFDEAKDAFEKEAEVYEERLNELSSKNSGLFIQPFHLRGSYWVFISKDKAELEKAVKLIEEHY